MNRTAVFKDRIFLEHDPGYGHVESADRLAVIYDDLETSELGEKMMYPSFRPATHETLSLIHSKDHVKRIAATAGRPFDILDPDTRTSELSYEAACMAAGAVADGVEMLMAGEIDNGFALVRPPGHHAEKSQAMGFCLFNNIAVGAAYAISRLAAEKVLIIDWDLHHGNGTQHSFYDTDKVLYFSTHQYPYYPGTGALTETGRGKGAGFNINVPLSGGQDTRAFVTIFDSILTPIARQYKPDLILVSAGFDIFMGDPLGGMSVTADGFGVMAEILNDLARELCDGRILFVLEGGYNLHGLRDGVSSVLSEISGTASHSETLKEMRREERFLPVLEKVTSVAKDYWVL